MKTLVGISQIIMLVKIFFQEKTKDVLSLMICVFKTKRQNLKNSVMILINHIALSTILVKDIVKWTLQGQDYHQWFGTTSVTNQLLTISSQIIAHKFVSIQTVIAEHQKMISENNLSMKFMVLLADVLLVIMYQKLINLTEESIQDVRNNTVAMMK